MFCSFPDAEPALIPPPLPVADGTPTAGPDRVLRRLAGSLAHTFNNALTGVIGYLELALRQAVAGSELSAHLRASLECAHLAAGAVKRIVAFAARSPGHPALAPVSLRAVAEQAVESVRATPGVAVVLPGTSPGWVRASEGLLREALDALIRNAVEAMPQGGTLTLRVEADEEGQPCLRVCDTGVGMPPDLLAHLFEPFRTTKSAGHLGLGLTLCRELIHAQGGRLRITSAAGQGTTATLSFPPPEEAASLRCDDSQAVPATPHWAPAVSLPLGAA
jgi:signal transduction histidine kinase